MSGNSRTHSFTVLFRIPGATAPEGYAERVYESAALGDVLLGGPDSTATFDADFERAGRSLPGVVLGAIDDLRKVLPRAEILRVEPDDLVTIAAIAHRVDRSHESVRLLAHGERGPGGFPASVGHLDAKTRVWRWSEVAPWFEESMGIGVPGGTDAAFLAALNDILDLRRVADEAIDDTRIAQRMAALLPSKLADPT